MRSCGSTICCNSTAVLQGLDGGPRLPVRQHFNCSLQRWVFLPNDLFQLCGSHTSFLQLLEGTASFHALMLASVANQQNPVTGAHPFQKVPHLIRTGETRFIDEEESFLRVVRFPRFVRGRENPAMFRHEHPPALVASQRGKSVQNLLPDSPWPQPHCG